MRASRNKQKVTLFHNISKIGNYDTTYQVFVENGNLVIAVGANMRKREWTPKKKSDGRVLSMLISVKISLQSLSSCTIFLERKDSFLSQIETLVFNLFCKISRISGLTSCRAVVKVPSTSNNTKVLCSKFLSAQILF